MRRELDFLDSPALLLAWGPGGAVGGRGVGRQDYGIRGVVLQVPAVERASSTLHRHRRGDYGARVRDYPLAGLIVVRDRPDILPEKEFLRVRVLQVRFHVA